VGRIAETELLQIELRSKNAETEVAAELLNFQTANEALRNFLGLQSDVEFSLLSPESLLEYTIDVEKAVAFAHKNRSQTTEFRRRRMQAEMGMEEANKSTGFRVDLSGYFGLSNSAETIGDAYKNPVDQERITLSLEIPIADWGKSRARKEIARSNLELTLRNLEQDQINFEREIILKVQQIILKRNQMALAAKAFEVAEKRLEIAKNRYQIGKIGVTDLNIALNEYDSTRRAHFQSLWTLWTAHYEIRNLTLYDFIEDKELVSENPLGE
jgi:outer membrane protein TolC